MLIRLIYCQIDWLVDSFFVPLIDWSIDCLLACLIDWFIYYSSIDWLIDLVVLNLLPYYRWCLGAAAENSRYYQSPYPQQRVRLQCGWRKRLLRVILDAPAGIGRPNRAVLPGPGVRGESFAHYGRKQGGVSATEKWTFGCDSESRGQWAPSAGAAHVLVYRLLREGSRGCRLGLRLSQRTGLSSCFY